MNDERPIGMVRLAWSLILAVAVCPLASCGRTGEGPGSTKTLSDCVGVAASEGRIDLVDVDSSAMTGVGYDAEQRILSIQFPNGDVYRYFDVPAEVHRGLMAADSHGQYFHRHIRDAGYKYEKVD